MQLDPQILVLVTIDEDRRDSTGRQYPVSGKVKCETFIRDKSILHGLFGSLWGEVKDQKWIKNNDNSIWVVVRINNNYHVIDKENNIVKFHEGHIIYEGKPVQVKEFLKNAKEKISCGS